MGKYHLTSPKNNISQQQQYIAIPPENRDVSHKYLIRFSWFISSRFQWLFYTPKPFWSRKIRLKWQHVGQELSCAPCHSPLRKRGNLGVTFCFNTPRYFWCGNLSLLPKTILHLFLSIQISVIWNLNSNLG